MNRLQVVKKLSGALLFTCLLGGQIHAQTMPSKADKQFEMGMYHQAATSYEEAIAAGGGADIATYERLAECYINTNKPFEAIATYEEAAMRYDMSADSYLKWAAALKKIGRDEEANEIISFASIKGNKPFHEMEVKELPAVAVGSYVVQPASFNSSGNEFAPAFLGNDVVCVTDNYDILQTTGVSTNVSELPHILMRVDGNTGEKVRLRGRLRDYINDGPTSYSADGSTVCFSKGHFPAAQSPKIGNKQSGSIYVAEADQNGDWDLMISLPANELGTANIYPYLQEDGNRVYFASNREGGFGGFDIYYTERIGDGWTAPRNLGKHVNTSGDEISPSVDGDMLYFASNQLPGKGGYDLFSYDQRTKVAAVNMGEGVNSSWDDYALITKDKGASGYFTSNRSGGAGGEDIYSFQRGTAKSTNQPMAVNQSTYRPAASAKPTTVSYKTTTNSSASAKPTDTYNAPVSAQDAAFDIPTFKVATDATRADRIRTIYTIQVAALSQNNASYKTIAKKLEDIGFVYKVFYHNVIKIRVGQFDSDAQARQILSKVKDRGYKDAFVVKEQLVREEAPSTTYTSSQPTTTYTPPASTAPVRQPSQTTYSAPTTSTSEPAYKADIPKESYNRALENITRYRIKLGSFTSMTAFDDSVVKRYGSIFQEEDGEWTKVYLGDYMSIEDAEAIRNEVVRAGFSSAIIYGMHNGSLVRVK